MNLFYEGGLLFMSLLTLCGIVGVFFAIKKKYDLSRSIAVFSLVLGVMGQLIGLYSAFSVMEISGKIAPEIMYSGLRVSMITTLYGLFIYLILQAWSFIAVYKQKIGFKVTN